MAKPNTKAPLWLTLGSALGLGIAWLASGTGDESSPKHSAAPPAPRSSPPVPELASSRPTLDRIEDLFMTWGGYCVWKDNLTQFAAWRKPAGPPTDYYEVRRSGGKFYFRTLPRADWPLIDHGQLVRCPLWFAEPWETQEQFYRENPSIAPGRPEFVELPERLPLLPPLRPVSGDTPLPAISPLIPTPQLPDGSGR
jgi:hypothetical protein